MTLFQQYQAGHDREVRRSTRRRTLATVTVVKGPEFEEDAAVTNLSVEGAFVRTTQRFPIGTRFVFRIDLPTSRERPIQVGAEVVREDEDGLGLLFVDIQSRDRSRLREYARFAEMDDTVVRVQRRMDTLLSGNLLPISDHEAIEERLKLAADRRLKALVVDPVRNTEPIWATVGLDSNGLRLHEMERPLSDRVRAVYIVVFDGPLHFMFEGLLAERGPNPLLLEPERMYHNERRAGLRKPLTNAWMEFEATHLEDGILRLPVIDLSERGCAIRASKSSLIIPGMRLPPFQIEYQNTRLTHPGATVRRLASAGSEDWLVGLNFAGGAAERDAFAEIHSRPVKNSIWVNLTRFSSLAKQKIRSLVRVKGETRRDQVNVARYKNDRGDGVTALLDASFDLREDQPSVDVAVIVAPAFLRRKEVFSLLARTLIDNFKAQKINGVVLRFDATHTVGESEVDPELEKKGCPYLRWTFSHLESDIKASLQHVERRFRPKKRVVVTFSVAAMAARRFIADNGRPSVDHWIAPFGCPDAQDMFQNYLAGIDLFQKYSNGQSAEPFLIYGRLADPNHVFPDAMRRGMAFLDQARQDMARITCPVTWIVGTYDYMVTRERVRQMLNAPDGGPRKVYEMASGHVLKTGAEAIESFKLISESIFRHIFGLDVESVEPDMGLYLVQDKAEWARVSQVRLTDAAAFWSRHLFGTGDEREGYDVLLHNPDYVAFLREQAALLDPRPSERVADIGCGTGNFSLALLDRSSLKEAPFSLDCFDLVPEAVNVTRRKLEKKLAETRLNGSPKPAITYNVLDLETARLQAVREFLEGELYSVGALAGRLEGLPHGTVRKLEEAYSQELHAILRGKPATVEAVRAMAPELDETEAELVLDLSCLARYVRDQAAPSDFKCTQGLPDDAGTLRLKHLTVSPGRRDGRLPLPSERFDKIGSSLVVSYVYDPRSVLKEFHRLLVPGGRVVLSSLKPNFDASKSYLEEAKTIAERRDLAPEERQRLLDSLREFASFVGCVMELEDEGRFKFFSKDELAGLMRECGFVDIQTTESFGRPATAVIAQARKPA